MDKTPDPIKLTEKDVLEFMAIYKKQFGKEIDYETAYDQAAKLVRIMQIVHRPITKEQYEAVMAKDKKKLDAN